MEGRSQKSLLKHLAAGVPDVYTSKRIRIRRRVCLFCALFLLVAILLTAYTVYRVTSERWDGRVLVVLLVDSVEGRFYSTLESHLQERYDMTVDTFLEKTNAELWTYSEREQMIAEYGLEGKLDGKTMEKMYWRFIVLDRDGNVAYNDRDTEAFLETLDELGFEKGAQG